mmetsp:Transcript_2385/g.4428  ORF Transcript_2385/g.4428 Transcript_2385/m.4428 type:complete len:86 (-) Transcript_2385:205-462(-)
MMTSLELESISRDPGSVHLVLAILVVVLFHLTGFGEEGHTKFGISSDGRNSRGSKCGARRKGGSDENCRRNLHILKVYSADQSCE